MAYAYKPAKTEQARSAKARVDDVNASFKDLCNVCQNIRGRRSDAALEFLTEAADGKRPIRYFRHNKRRGHVGELGGKKGGWPVKSCRIVRDVLANAIANAEAKGLSTTKVAHVQANKMNAYPRMSAKGRRVRQDLETAFVEVVLEEIRVPGGAKAAEKKEVKIAEKKAEPIAAEKKAEAPKTTDEKKV